MKLKILYVFTSTNEQPFLDIRKFGILPTWPNLVESTSEVLALIGLPPRWTFLAKPIANFHERLRWNRFGRYFMAMSEYLLIPLSCWNPKVTKNDGTLNIGIPESYLFMGFKHLAAYEYALKHNFDFLVATNSSSFINVPAIENFLGSLQQNENPFYAGKPLPHAKHGASGSFYILNKIALSNICGNRNRWRHSHLDDIALRALANKLNFNFQELSSINAYNPHEINLITKEIFEQNLHFKIGPCFLDGIRNDAKNLQLIYNKFNLHL